MEILHGKGTEGLAKGIAFVLSKSAEAVSVKEAGSVAEELSSLDAALDAVREDLGKLAAGSGIFEAHLEMLEDPMLYEQIQSHIEEGLSALSATEAAAVELAAMFADIDDEYLRARADDVKDVCGRIARAISGDGSNPFAAMPDGSVVVADELAPSDTAQMDLSRVRAFVTDKGSSTSHVCIIARNNGIPAIVGIGSAIDAITAGDLLLVNGETGEVFVRPDVKTREGFDALLDVEANFGSLLQEKAAEPALTADGRKISVNANAGSINEVRIAMESGADGIGLFRSEFLYMHSDALPSEEMQFAAYRDAARLCGGKPLVIRTMDIGGDKALSYMPLPQEENPFLGFRAIRICLRRPKMFKTQLRAILRASAFGCVKIMLPMIASLEELTAAKELAVECMQELASEGKAFDEDIQLGIMIETPAAVFMADKLAAECDFFSIGTNDLTQYVMAADRGNAEVANLYDPKNQAVLRAIGMTIDAAHHAGITVSMCGEMASDPSATDILLRLGLDSFSVAATSVGRIKAAIRTL